MDDHAALPHPSLARHLAAMTYDLFLVVAVVAVVNALALGIQVKLLGSTQHQLMPWVAQMLSVFSVWGFFCLFWLTNGQTLGMQAWRIKLVAFDGASPRLTAALLRCLGATLSFACGGLGYLWGLIDPHRRYWHDHLSRTELVLMPKRESNHAK